MTDEEVLGQRLVRFRILSGISCQELADAMKIEISQLYPRQSGRCRIKASDMAKIKRSYPHFDANEFLTGGRYD